MTKLNLARIQLYVIDKYMKLCLLKSGTNCHGIMGVPHASITWSSQTNDLKIDARCFLARRGDGRLAQVFFSLGK